MLHYLYRGNKQINYVKRKRQYCERKRNEEKSYMNMEGKSDEKGKKLSNVIDQEEEM